MTPRTGTLTSGLMARRLRVSRRWLVDQARAGLIPALPTDRDFLFNPQAVERCLSERAAGQTAESRR